MPTNKPTPPKRKSRKKNSIPVKVGTVSVPIYPMADGRFCIVWRPSKDSPRERVTRKTLAAAKEKATEICQDILSGQVSAGRLTSDQLLQAATALQLLTPHGLSLDVAARDLDAALRATHGVPISELVRFWAKHHKAGTSKREPYEVLAAMLTAKLSQGLDKHGLRNLRSNLEKFCIAFRVPIGEITATEIRSYIDKLTIGQRSKNNTRRDLVTLFRFAQAEGDLVEDKKTEAEKVGRWKESKKPPAVFTPHEMSEWLGVARKEWESFIALGAFAGIRSFEIERMDWTDILWMQEQIYLRPEITKTGEGRYIPLHPNLAQWLLPHRRSAGLIRPEKGRFNKEFARMAAALKRPWNQNALRHSYGSYRLAILQDLGKLTVEMGNSVGVNRKNYQSPRSRQSAVEWFSLVPAGTGKIIAGPRPGTA